MQKAIIAILIAALYGCGGGDSTDTVSAKTPNYPDYTPSISQLAGVWDSSAQIDGLVDVAYMVFRSNYSAEFYDYLGDEYDLGEDCYYTGESIENELNVSLYTQLVDLDDGYYDLITVTEDLYVDYHGTASVLGQYTLEDEDTLTVTVFSTNLILHSAADEVIYYETMTVDTPNQRSFELFENGEYFDVVLTRSNSDAAWQVDSGFYYDMAYLIDTAEDYQLTSMYQRSDKRESDLSPVCSGASYAIAQPLANSDGQVRDNRNAKLATKLKRLSKYAY
ncbi:hypothetical protein QWY77_11115 [Thalassotalea ponticola]|nr:hypothetical protein [Thalassotalea ponticola]MDN3653292.1 hypothetical protein [Thalassotalea ponticola]